MFKFIKNKFLFIVIISVITLVLLVIGAIALYKDESLVFNNEGYIISTTTTKKSNTKYYFSANTKYKENADDDITFEDNSSKSVVVDPASFVHYNDGSIGYLKKGALVNLGEINSSIISYYNVNRNNLIKHENNKYVITTNGDDINVNAFVGRISDEKYIIAGSNLSLEIPNSSERIAGDYFEVLFIENGVVKIDNEENSYQVTAQDSYIYVGDNIIINLGNEKIYYNGSAKMLLSQITIDGDENINLDVEDSKNSGGGEGDGNGTEGENNLTETTTGNETTTGDETTTGEGNETSTTGDENQTGENNENTENSENNQNGNGSQSGRSDSAQIELISADVTSTSIDASLQLNNASSINGQLVAQLTNVLNNEKEDPIAIPAVNGTFKVTKNALLPDTEYTLTIIETGNNNEKQYFQKTFKTKKLGISLEKQYATENSLSYNVIFDENTDVSRVKISIYDNNGSNESISPNEYIVENNEISPTVEFTGLKSNTSYSVSIDTIWIDNTAYSNLYTINRIDTTLKQTPTLSDIEVKTNAEEIIFNIEVKNINDPDNSIISYTYEVYEADSIGLDGTEPILAYSTTKNDKDAIELNLNEIEELKTGVNYRCKVVAQYNDNEMIREVESDYSGNFLIKSKPNIKFEQETATMNSVSGTITLIDANCTVPLSGRSCFNRTNNITLRYYKLGTDETSENDQQITFNPSTLQYKMNLKGLSSDTTYIVKIYGDYYDDDSNAHTNVQIGDPFYIKTDESEHLKLKIIGDNISGTNKDGTENSANVVTFDAVLNKPQDSTIEEEVSSIKMNLYSGSYNVADKLIGTYTMTDKTQIEDFFSSFTITNSLFNNQKLGKLDSLNKMIQVTNNSTGTLNGAYTVEIERVLDSTGRNEIPVEDNIYTFKLTPSYYLDSRIETNPNYKYINVTPIMKKDLTEDEYTMLSQTVDNLDALNEDTIVGLTIDNSLSDAFVDSAFTYEKVIVDYVIYNSTTNREIKRVSTDMGNKYQPKSKTIYLDSSDLDDGKNYFTRGYDYKVSYELKFTTENGDNPTYTHDKLSQNLSIDRQSPIISQYISTSKENSVTYRYSITDVDNALYDNNLYYTVGDNNEYQSADTKIEVDGNYHDIKIPIEEKSEYSVYINRKNTKGKNSYTEITKSEFESEYDYNGEVLYNLVNDNDNTLKIKFIDNDITKRAVAYGVTIKATDDDNIENYKRYFLAGRLNTEQVDTGGVDAEGNPITNTVKYIAIDYANISRFMKHNLEVSVEAYYDSGLIGINQKFPNGLILENKVKGRYLNIYNTGSTTTTTNNEDTTINGIYFLKEDYVLDSTNIYIYNYLENTNNYNPSEGATYYDTDTLPSNAGINYNLSMTNNGIVFNDGKKDFEGYNVKVLKAANLNATSKSYRFNNIVPKVSLSTAGSTINSIKLNITSSGVYGQFEKDGQVHNKYYIDIYSDPELSNKLTTLTSDITINDGTATAEQVEYKNLKPDTTYYITISAYVDGKLTRLYDMSSQNSYTVKTYEAKTLNSDSILEKITLSVNPTSYNNESSNKTLSWRLKLKSTENYKIRFELFDKDNNPVNFDGSVTSSCNNNNLGSSDNGYVSGCYIQVGMEELENINNKNIEYIFTGDKFVFGGEYYKLYVYAVPYTNNTYNEEDKVILYQNESLSTTGDKIVAGEPDYNITIPTLEEAIFNLNNTLTSGYRGDDENGEYYIEFTPTVTDVSKVIKYGTYTAKLKDESNVVVETKEGIRADAINQVITFTKLKANTLYYIELSYETYRNNNGFSEAQKIATTPFTDFIYTPIDAGITLGTITAQRQDATSIILAYNGASNMTNNIVRVSYTVSLKGGSSKVSGEYSLDENDNIFEIGADKTPRLTLDFKDNTSGFSLSSGNTYIISTQYWYLEDGEEVLLEDRMTGNTTFTAILNL